jgi:uncharacterized damage-inducible protein DinB
MTLAEVTTLLDYHYWARDRLLDAVETLTPEQLTRDMGSSFRSVRDTLVHLCQVEWIWHARWNGTSPAAPLQEHLPERFTDAASIRRLWSEHERAVRAFVEKLGEAGLSRTIDYRNMAGQPGRSAYWQMLQHLVNHASYHRGQVTTMVRQLGGTPAKSMDLIAFYRERERT